MPPSQNTEAAISVTPAAIRHGARSDVSMAGSGVPGTPRRLPYVAVTLFAVSMVLALYWSTAVSMVRTWMGSETFTHGFVVLPISLWLVWRMRQEVMATPFGPSWWAAGVSIVPAGIWLAGELLQANALRQFALVALVILAVVACLGTAAARKMSFPLGFLFFAVPFGEFLLPQLMDWTARFTILALRLSGIPVFEEGLRFVIPSGSWSVVEACSGVRYLIASAMVGTLYAYLTFRTLRRRLAFIAVALLVPVVANWVRAYLIVMVGHFSNNRLAVGVDHLIYGWVFFGFVMLLMFWIGAKWQEPSVAPDSHATTPRPFPTLRDAGVARSATAALALISLAAVPFAADLAIVRGTSAAAVRIPAIAPAGWSPASTAATGWRPKYESASLEYQQSFVRADDSVTLYIAYYRDQSSERKLASSINRLVTSEDSRWILTGSGPERITPELTVQVADLRGNDGRRLKVWQWYWIDGTLTDSATKARLLLAREQLLGRGDDGAVVIVATPVSDPDSGSTADRVLAGFVRDALPVVHDALQTARDAR